MSRAGTRPRAAAAAVALLAAVAPRPGAASPAPAAAEGDPPTVEIRAASVDRGRRHLVLDVEVRNGGPQAVVALVVPPIVFGPADPLAACGIAAPALGLGPVVQIRPPGAADAPDDTPACAVPPALPPAEWAGSLVSLPPGGRATLLVTAESDEAWAEGLAVRFVLRWTTARSLLRRLQRQAFEATRGLYLVAGPGVGLQRPDRLPRVLRPFSAAVGSEPLPLRDREGPPG